MKNNNEVYEMKNNTAKKITRGISAQFAEMFVQSELFALYQANQEDLFLGVRNEYINIYYNAANVCKITYNRRKKQFSCKVAKKYLGDNRKGYCTLTVDKLCDNYMGIRKVIRDEHSPSEKTAQQQLVHKNNRNNGSKWYCIDIEYVKQRNNNGEAKYGRFDIIAVSKAKPHKVALIELKYNSSAMGGNSGILKHVQDYISFIGDHIYEDHLKPEIVDIVNSQSRLKNCPFCIADVCELAETPEIYFITLDNEGDKPRNTMRRYVLNGVADASKRNVEKEHGVDITKPNTKNFSPVFLFSDNKVGCIEIDDIIESELYTRGL